jgi:hypothetical protein
MDFPPTSPSGKGPAEPDVIQRARWIIAAHRARSDDTEQHAVERWTAPDLLAGDQW